MIIKVAPLSNEKICSFIYCGFSISPHCECKGDDYVSIEGRVIAPYFPYKVKVSLLCNRCSQLMRGKEVDF